MTDSTTVRILKGTLLMPYGKKSMPVALVIAGSGPTDRNGNSPGLTSDYLKMLAEGLAAQGIASLRYDKRGVAKSKMVNPNESSLVIEDFSADAGSWLDRLKGDPRFSHIVIVGHSEGSLLFMLAAQRHPADGFVSLAGAGRPLDVVLKEQLKANPNNPLSLVTNANTIIDSLKSGHLAKQIDPLLLGLFRPSVQPFLISWLKYDPAVEIKKLSIPVMIVQGTTDIQVLMADAEALHFASPKARYSVVDGMNHVLRDAPAERSANIRTYMQPDMPINTQLVRTLGEFIQGLR